ncbi:MAG: phosphatase PAP2 family protein [Candidatus Roizmanbacteria bacterium]|nr:phosphatase PAP2 family protein [Candidatus Roizmanbacteria bacterium]
MGNEMLISDLHILQFIYHLRSPFLTSFMIFITNFGGQTMLGLGVIVVMILYSNKYEKDAIQFALIAGGAWITNILLKIYFHRMRPQFHPLIVEKDYSFPSGHAMNSIVFYTTLAYFIFYITKNKKLSIYFTILSFLLIMLIGISRVYLGVHYPTDVLGGYVAGAIWLLSIFLMTRLFKLKHIK